jgi:hypothetical protein
MNDYYKTSVYEIHIINFEWILEDKKLGSC